MAYVPQDLLDRIAALEREVRTLRGRAQMRPALNQVLNGDVVIGEGGRLLVRAPTGPAVFETGQAAAGDYATRIRRDTGEDAITVGANMAEDDDAPEQMVRIWNRNGRPILMDDYYSPEFLGRPWMPFPMYPTAYQRMQGTTAFEYAWVGRLPAQNPVAVLWFGSSSTNGGQVRINYLRPDGGTTTLGPWTIPTGGAWFEQTITQPLDGAAWGDHVVFQVEHRNNASSGVIETRVITSYTRNTVTAAEAPDAP